MQVVIASAGITSMIGMETWVELKRKLNKNKMLHKIFETNLLFYGRGCTTQTYALAET